MNKSIFFTSLIFILSGIFFSACDEIENPLKEQSGNTCGDETLPVPIRKILIEDYTGHTCVNCPEAAAKIDELKERYCDHIIPISVHAGYFAQPTEDYPEDFRTEAGEEFVNKYNINMFPAGLINRVSFQENPIVMVSNWTLAADSLLKQEPQLQIDIDNQYNTTNNEILLDLKFTFLESMSDSLLLSVMIAEDSIIAPQLSQSGRIDDYVHRHVLRKYITDYQGELLSSNGGQLESSLSKTIKFTPDSAEWKMKHCEIIAYVSRAKNGEIIQAESEHLHIGEK